MTTPRRFAAGAVDLGQFGQAAQKSPHSSPQSSQSDAGQVSLCAAVTPETFESDLVMPSTKVVVVTQVGSARSTESDQMRGYFQQMVNQQDAENLSEVTWLFRYVDVDQHPEIAQAFKVQAVPTVIALAAGRPLTQFEGAQSPDQLQQWVGALLQATQGKLPGLAEEQQDPRMAQAADYLEAGEVDAALAVYDSILAEEPKNQEAIAARAQALLLARMSSEEFSDTSAEEATDPFVKADRLLVSNDKVGAFSVLVDHIVATSGDEREEAKKRLFELFAMYEPGDPDVIAARTAMASALF
ncbi:tetratricopeptide repeat protein [Corynebacterium sp. 320]|uniref:tetratricopeptide repeat protein n=1 Tax=Corynebacterium TaxID=1716 RepID=UPI00125CB5E3|nr:MULTISPECIES: tetratricopeptide repeat protein [Corynebacterium]KAB1503931.1 tetratricopeptide repeat protein [Corynebacterium sp. 320]KAB1552970.1 tetratricopeptide repeat protein [Corynebacterium sp. 321]KAB1553810.1 tetratricopeptide repeat protein [Corynebacterium sp. 319]KAB3528067.1 tetratricopeptide repeat protein [Corynebacterium sp. 250]KAB3540445.1 tetratricopeptide repeat protein [Corynebacterium sp. 366]